MKFDDLKGTQCYKCDSKDQNWCGGSKEELDKHKDNMDTSQSNGIISLSQNDPKAFWCTTDATCMMVKEGMSLLERRDKISLTIWIRITLCPFLICI